MRLIVARILAVFFLALFAVLIPTLVSAAPTGLPDSPRRVKRFSAGSTPTGTIPSPDRCRRAVRGMSRLGLLTDTEGAGVHVGFLAGIIATNPDEGRRADRENVSALAPSINGRSCARLRIRDVRTGERCCSAIADAHAGAARDDRAIPRRQAADARPVADREGRDLGREIPQPDHAREVLRKAARPTRRSTLTPDLLDTLWGYYYAHRQLSSARRASC